MHISELYGSNNHENAVCDMVLTVAKQAMEHMATAAFDVADDAEKKVS